MSGLRKLVRKRLPRMASERCHVDRDRADGPPKAIDKSPGRKGFGL